MPEGTAQVITYLLGAVLIAVVVLAILGTIVPEAWDLLDVIVSPFGFGVVALLGIGWLLARGAESSSG